MELIDLLDKSEKRQIEILFFLMETDKPVLINEVAEKLGVYRNTIKEDLVLLKGNLLAFKDNLKLSITRDDIHLEVYGDITTLEILHEFLRFSINYQIIIYILENISFEISALANHLTISVATLSRRIKLINELLEEFELTIRSGRIQGTEMQIRYFYFLIAWYGMPFHRTKEKYSDASVLDLIRVLERELKINFNEDGQMKIQIWLHITKLRLRSKIYEKTETLNANRRYNFKDSQFKKIYEIMARYFSRYAFDFDNDEATLFYLFILSNFTVEINNKESFSFYEEAQKHKYYIYNLNVKVKKEIENRIILENTSEHFQKIFDLYLYSIHIKIYYFKGFVYFFGKSGIERMFDNFPDPELLHYCEQLALKTFKFMNYSKKECQRRFRQLLENYGTLMYIAYRDVDVRLKVGCDFPLETTLASVFADNIYLHADVRIPVEWEMYDSNQMLDYDVIITNIKKEYPGYPKEQVFLMFAIEYNTDIKKLNGFLRDNYREKLFRLVTKE